MIKALKRVGIFMDHSTANIMEYALEPKQAISIDSKFTYEEKINSIARSEHLMHNKEQHDQAEYYKKLGEIILHYDEVILFGPTKAKLELFNVLTADHRFAEIRVLAKQTDKLTEREQQSFVKEYFSKQLS